MLEEASILQEMRSHAAVTRFVDVLPLPTPGSYAIVTELALEGDLFDHVAAHGPLCETAARNVLRQLVDALACLHARRVGHRDVKLENIYLVGQGEGDPCAPRILLGDFGFAKRLSPPGALRCPPSAALLPQGEVKVDAVTAAAQAAVTELLVRLNGAAVADACGVPAERGDLANLLAACAGVDVFCDALGTPAYLAPEVAQTILRQRAGYGLHADLWAAGVCAYVLVTGEQPFGPALPTSSLLSLLAAGPSVPTDSRLWRATSPAGRRFISRLLAPEPLQRPTAAEALALPWFTSPPQPTLPLSLSADSVEEPPSPTAASAHVDHPAATAGGSEQHGLPSAPSVRSLFRGLLAGLRPQGRSRSQPPAGGKGWAV